MIALLAKLTPLAIGAAVSPVMLAATILILSGRERPLRRAIVFALGATLVLSAIGIFTVFVLGAATRGGSADGNQTRTHTDSIDVAFGVLLLALAGRQVTRILKGRAKPDAPDAHDAPDDEEIEAAVPEHGTATIKYLAGGAAAMLLNFSTVVIYIPAIRILAGDQYTGADQAVGFVFVTLVAMSLVLVPIGLYAVAPGAAARILEPIGRWTKLHSKEIGAVILFVIGVYLIFKGISTSPVAAPRG